MREDVPCGIVFSVSLLGMDREDRGVSCCGVCVFCAAFLFAHHSLWAREEVNSGMFGSLADALRGEDCLDAAGVLAGVPAVSEKSNPKS